MGKLIVELPEHLHLELKKKATLEQRTLKSVITELVKNYISEEQSPEVVSETGLCGAWQDQREPEEIIRDIKSHRKWSLPRRKT